MTALLGWDFDGNQRVAGYVRAWRDGRKVAGLGGPPDPRPGAGWRSYLATTNLDRSLAAATAQGATIEVQAVDVPPDGRFALLRDPQGAAFGLFESHGDPGTHPEPAPGCVGRWILRTPNPSQAVAFHHAAFGRLPGEYAGGARVVIVGDAEPAGWQPVFRSATVPNRAVWRGPLAAWEVPGPSGQCLLITGSPPGGDAG